ERHPERDVPFETLSQVPVDPVYTPEDLAGFDVERDLGYPGSFPYTRGVRESMYRGRLWTMRMFAGFGTAEPTHEGFKKLLAARPARRARAARSSSRPGGPVCLLLSTCPR